MAESSCSTFSPQFLTPSTLSTVQSILGSSFSKSLGPAATVRTKYICGHWRLTFDGLVGRHRALGEVIQVLRAIPFHRCNG